MRTVLTSSGRRRVALFIVISLATSALARAQILYTKYNGSVFQLRQVNADGTGDTAVATPFANLAFPEWSRDRALIALTATDPARPSQISLNAYTFNPATGAIQNVTNFQDYLGTSHSVEYAFYKAFSPNRQFLAVNSVISSGNQNGSSDTPILQIFPSDGSSGSLATVHVGFSKDGIHHDGEGITWSPTQNILATPVRIDTPLQSGGGKGETTAIFIADPVTNAGNARQLTFPHADQVATPTDGYYYGEHDYQPRFSPDGTKVAYVRSFQIARYVNNYVPDPDTQSLHIININTGADTEVLKLPQAQYVSTVDWSPDGTALVFDAGQEYSSSGIPGQAVQPGTDQVFVVNVDGTGLRELRGAGSGMPAWAPNPLPGAAVQISTRLAAGTGDNTLSAGFIVQGSGSKKILIRGIGTSLQPFFGNRSLADPILTLRNSQTGQLLGTNDNWKTTQTGGAITGDQSAEIQASGLAPTQDAESVIIATLPPGQYTAEVKGAGGGTGFALAEIYDRDPTASAFLANISTRGFVQTDDNIMISGLFVANQTTRMAFRALGPTLAEFGVPNAMADPTLDLVNANGTTIATNDNWQEAANASEVPAYLHPGHASEAVIVASLLPDHYTVQLRGVNRSTGNALIEAYVLK